MAVEAMLLADEFGPEAFTQESLKAIADKNDFFPSHQVIRDGLLAHLSSRRAITGFVATSLPDWLRDKILSEVEGCPGNQLRGWLAGKGVSDGEISQWLEDRRGSGAGADWKDPAKIRESLSKLGDGKYRKMMGRLLVALVHRHAPENLGHIPPEFQEP